MKIQAAVRMRSASQVRANHWQAPFKQILEPLSVGIPPQEGGEKITKEQWIQVEKAFKDKGYEVNKTSDFENDMAITPKGDSNNGLYFDFDAMKLAWYKV